MRSGGASGASAVRRRKSAAVRVDASPRDACDLRRCSSADSGRNCRASCDGTVAGIEQLIDVGHDFGGLVLAHGLQHVLEDGVGDGAHQLANLRGVEARRGRRRSGAEAIAWSMIESASRMEPSPASASSARASSSASMFSCVAIARSWLKDVVEAYRVKAEVLAARADGLRNVLGLGGRHHEDDVVGRLFESLQQRVEGGVGDLVGFVENVDLVAVARRTIARGLAQFANLVDAAVGGGVDLDDVDGIARANLGAGVANSARLGGGALSASRCLRQFSAMARMRATVVLPMPRCPLKM